MTEILFRCDASKTIGTGHVARCLNLAKVLRDKGAHCTFSTIEDTVSAVPALKKEGFDIISPEQWREANPDFIIIDHYDLSDEFYSNVNQSDISCLMIDDLCDREFYNCNFLLVNNIARQASNYQGKIPPECEIFDGPESILIHPDFLNSPAKNNTRKIPVEKLFLFFGGTDPAHLTLRVLNIIQGHNIIVPHIDVVIGNANPDEEKIKSLCADLGAELHIQIDHMADIMGQADLAVGCGGTAIWERLSLNVPALEMTHSDYQIETLRFLHQHKYLHYMGDCRELTDSDIAEALVKALEKWLDLRYCQCGGKMNDIADKIINFSLKQSRAQ